MHKRPTSLLFTLFLAVTLTMGLTACDSNDSDGGLSFGGSSDVNVSGANAGGNFSGFSLFATSNDLDQSEPAFAIVMFNISESDTTVVSVGRDGDALPAPGSYDIGDATANTEKFTGIYLYTAGSNNQEIAVSQSGTLNLSSATESKMTGDFNFTGVHPFGGSDVSVSGSFDANRATPEQIDELDSVLNDF